MRDLFRLLGFLLWMSKDIRFSRQAVALIAIASSVGGIASAAMMALITQALTPTKGLGTVMLPWVFAALCLILPAFRFLSQWLLIWLTQRSFLTLRLRLT